VVRPFAVFRRIIRPGILCNPFVCQLTRELQKFHEVFRAGKRPKLAILCAPQHGKSWAAEDYISWVAGKHPNLKTIYASYRQDLGELSNRNLQRLFTSSVPARLQLQDGGVAQVISAIIS
jgi:hypothetical protein